MEYLNRDAFTGAGRMSGKPKGIVIHNDAGAMGAKDYSVWLDNHNKSLGVAHYYGDRFAMLRYVPTTHMAWHTGESRGNTTMLGYEVVESLHKKTTDKQFIENEEAIFKQAAEDMDYYNLPIDTDHVFLHRSLNPTSCPHRSWEIHVPKGKNPVKDEYGKWVAPNTPQNREYLAQYFVNRIKVYSKRGGNQNQTSPNVEKPKKATYHKEGNRYYTVKTDKLGIYRNKDLTGKYVGGWFSRGSKIWVGEIYVMKNGVARGKNPTGWISMNTDFIK